MNNKTLIKEIVKAINEIGIEANWVIEVTHSHIWIEHGDHHFAFFDAQHYSQKDLEEESKKSNIPLDKVKVLNEKMNALNKERNKVYMFLNANCSTFKGSIRFKEIVKQLEQKLEELEYNEPLGLRFKLNYHFSLSFKNVIEISTEFRFLPITPELQRCLIENDIKESDLHKVFKMMTEFKTEIKKKGCTLLLKEDAIIINNKKENHNG